MMQYVLFNALDVEYAVLVYYLRKIVECWKGNRFEVQKHLDILNKFKEKVDHYESFQEIWQILRQVDDKALTRVQVTFMMMLEKHEMLDYALRAPRNEPKEDLLQGEVALTALEDNQDDDGAVYENKWKDASYKSRLILLQVFTHKHMLMVPIQWEGSIKKLLRKGCLNSKLHTTC